MADKMYLLLWTLARELEKHPALVYPIPDLGIKSSWWVGTFHAGLCYSATHSFPTSSKMDPMISGSLPVCISVFGEELDGTSCES